MDWPLIGAIAGAVTICGAVAAGGVVLLQSSDAPVQKATPAAAVRLFPSGVSSATVAAGGPVLVPSSSSSTLSPSPPPTPFSPFAVASASSPQQQPDQTLAFDQSSRLQPSKPPAGVKHAEVSSYAPRQTAPESGRPPPRWQEAKAEPSTTVQAPKAGAGGLKIPAQAGEGIQQIGPPQWRAVPTAKATYFNLGGHLDRNGVCDALASGHLREAFKAHRNYPKLPAHAKALIEAPTINLSRLAPYRALLGINDKVIEEEQAVRFERVGVSRTANTAGTAGPSYRGVDGDASGAAEVDAVAPVAVDPPDFEPLVLPPFK